MTADQPRQKTSPKSNRQSFAPKSHTPPETPLSTDEHGDIELYSSPDGAVTLPVRFDGETVWATQVQMAELFGTSRPNVNIHLNNAHDEGELDDATCKDFLQVRLEGSREVARAVRHHNLDAIIAVGYRVHSPRGVHFRKRATSVVRQRILDQNAARMRRVDTVSDLLASSSDDQLASIARIMQRYTGDFDRLADYDRGELVPPTETIATQPVDIDDVELALDATPIKLVGTPNPNTWNLHSDRMNPDAMSGRYRREGNHKGAGHNNDEAAWKVETVVTVPNSPTKKNSFPILATGLTMHHPGATKAGPLIAMKFHAELFDERGFVMVDRLYNGLKPFRFQLPIRQMGFRGVYSYKKKTAGLQGAIGDVILVGGCLYVKSRRCQAETLRRHGRLRPTLRAAVVRTDDIRQAR